MQSQTIRSSSSRATVRAQGSKFGTVLVQGASLQFGLPSGFTYDTWYTIGANLAGASITYSVGDISGSVSSGGSVRIDNVILQGHNTTVGVTYDIHWDNLAAVPEPSAFLFGGLVCSVLGLNYYRKKKQAKA